ncbi:MAG: PA0069 family radical SAM protein, partial [Gammaproteobacteria bacterium]
IYCYARPTHAYMDLSPGIDFETRLFAKPDAAKLLKLELGKPGYICTPIALGTNTDPYQPIERDYRITRQIIESLNSCNHPLTIVTKSRGVERDMDLLAAMAARNLTQVFVSVTTLDHDLARKLEPRATAPLGRLATLKRLQEAGIPTGVMFAPVIPALNDTEMESVLTAAAGAGVQHAGYVMLRLPHEVKVLFREWLNAHYPLKTDHIMNMVKDIRGGKENDPNFGSRMRGSGVYADMIARRFHKICRDLGLNKKHVTLDTSSFIAPLLSGNQLSLF